MTCPRGHFGHFITKDNLGLQLSILGSKFAYLGGEFEFWLFLVTFWRVTRKLELSSVIIARFLAGARTFLAKKTARYSEIFGKFCRKYLQRDQSPFFIA